MRLWAGDDIEIKPSWYDDLKRENKGLRKELEEAKNNGIKIKQETLKVLATVICNDIGIGVSAESILAYCTGAENKRMCPPYDADDFKRCHNLLSAFPEWKEKLKDIGKKHKQWGTVGEHWLEIEEAFVRKDYKSVCDMLDKYRPENKEE